MTDRELLELAAKAAGLDAQWDCPERGMMMLTPNGIDTMTWNPLTDDGDALRLAVKLGLVVDTHGLYSRVSITYEPALAVECHGDPSNPYAATRRAIVRAAAEVGRMGVQR